MVDGKRIIRSGLPAGEQIVVNGMQRVRPGMPVNPEPEMQATADAALTLENRQPTKRSATTFCSTNDAL